jgi:predicted metal-dependent phosphoesterase TrpH
MPRRQPFTALCQLAARSGRADLHVHTTASDGAYTPEQVVDLARRLGLSAVAVTDHDTLAAVPAALRAAGGAVEVVPGVEITAEHKGREIHLLAYFVRLDHPGLVAALEGATRRRAERFREMVGRLGLKEPSIHKHQAAALGRRHVAQMLVDAGRVPSVRDAFRHYLHDRSDFVAPKKRLPAAEALELVRQAGGVAAWAHPPCDGTGKDLAELRQLGLGAVEAEYPGARGRWARQLRAWAGSLGLAVSGGSDCHGPGPRSLGCRSITAGELEQLRKVVSSQ